MGSLYQRGHVWWAKYYEGGRPVRESTETAKEKEAREFLKLRGGRGRRRARAARASKCAYEEAEGTSSGTTRRRAVAGWMRQAGGSHTWTRSLPAGGS